MKNLYKKQMDKLLKLDILYFNDASLYGKLETGGGIYRIFLKRNRNKTLYVGKAKNIRQRLYNNLLMGQIRSHTLKRKFIREENCTDQKTAKVYLKRNCALQYLLENDGKERSFLEHYVIATLRSRLND